MKESQIKALECPEDQDKKVFNGFKRTLKSLGDLTEKQLAILSFEVWDIAYQRSAKTVEMNRMNDLVSDAYVNVSV